MKTKAAVLYKTGEPLVIEDGIDVPDLLPGQVLVKVAFSGVCRSQLMEVRGKRGPDAYLPHLLGHEGTGVVLGIGKGVTKVRAGDKVVVTWIKGKGSDLAGYGTKDDLVALYKDGGVLRMWKHDSTGNDDYVDIYWADRQKRVPFRAIADIWMIEFKFVEFHE